MSNRKYYYAFVLSLVLLVFNTETSFAQSASKKEISHEVAAQKGSVIRIVSSTGKLYIKSWDQPKVKVTVQVNVDTIDKTKTTENWFEDLGISVKPFSNRVDILTRPVFIGKVPGKPAPADVRFMADRAARVKTIGGSPKPAKVDDRLVLEVMTILVPVNSKLDLENKYGDVMITMDLDDAKLEVSNGTLDAQNIKQLELVSDYCNVNLGNVDNAEVEFSNGTFRAQNIKQLDLDSRSSNIEYEKGDYLYLRSQTDEININEITKVDGRKLYGSIKVDQLNGSFDLEGTNVDIKFRNITPDVSLIKINNKYGDVRLPVKNLKNYFVDFTGYYSTVFAPFEKQVVKEEPAKDEPASDKEYVTKALGDSRINKSAAFVGEMAPRRFTSTVGDNKGKHTKIELTCNSCTVDFK